MIKLTSCTSGVCLGRGFANAHAFVPQREKRKVLMGNWTGLPTSGEPAQCSWGFPTGARELLWGKLPRAAGHPPRPANVASGDKGETSEAPFQDSGVFIRGEPPNKKTTRQGHPYTSYL